MKLFLLCGLKKTGKFGFVILKLAMSKIFDRVKWGFLHDLREKMDFPAVFINVIFNYVSIVSYTILLNGVKHGLLFPERECDKGIYFHLIYSFFIVKVWLFFDI